MVIKTLHGKIKNKIKCEQFPFQFQLGIGLLGKLKQRGTERPKPQPGNCQNHA